MRFDNTKQIPAGCEAPSLCLAFDFFLETFESTERDGDFGLKTEFLLLRFGVVVEVGSTAEVLDHSSPYQISPNKVARSARVLALQRSSGSQPKTLAHLTAVDHRRFCLKLIYTDMACWVDFSFFDSDVCVGIVSPEMDFDMNYILSTLIICYCQVKLCNPQIIRQYFFLHSQILVV